MKKIFLLVLLISVLLFSGCIKMYIDQKIHSNYDSDYKFTIDMSGIAGMMGEDANFTDSCDNMQDDSIATELENFKCEVDAENYTIMFSGTRSLKDSGALTIEQGLFSTKYTYDASQAKEFLSMGGDSGINSIDSEQEMTEEQIKQMKALGVEMVYTLEMPGTITKTDIGEIKDNKVVIDLLTLTGKENLYVESEELGFGFVLGAAAIIILGIVLGLFWRSKKAQAAE